MKAIFIFVLLSVFSVSCMKRSLSFSRSVANSELRANSGCNIGNYKSLENSDYAHCDFRGGKEYELTGANFSKTILTYANFSGVKLNRADFTWADLSGANLKGADLISADFSNTNLSNANLKETILFDPENPEYRAIFQDTIVDPDNAEYLKSKGFSGFIIND